MAHEAVVVLSNAPALLLAKRIAHVLVEEGLVACVSLGAAGLSMYMWEVRLEGAEEISMNRRKVFLALAEISRIDPKINKEKENTSYREN